MGRDESACDMDEGWVSEEISLLMALDSIKDFSGWPSCSRSNNCRSQFEIPKTAKW